MRYDDRDGAGSASGADHRGVDRYRDGRDLARAGRARASRGSEEVPVARSRSRTRGRAGGDDGLAVRGRGAARDRSARVHLAEPAETSALRGPKRASEDRSSRRSTSARVADARQTAGVLDRARRTCSISGPACACATRSFDDRGEWQQRIRAVLYHHGIAHRAELDLMRAAGREWLAQVALPVTAREQMRVALEVIDALDAKLPPLDRELRAYARRQPGCQALQAHYGIGPLTAVAILAELGDCSRFSSSRHAVRYSRPGHHRVSVRSAPRARASLPPRPPGAALGAIRGRRAPPLRIPPTAPTTTRPPRGSGTSGHAWRSRANCSNAATTPSKNSATKRSSPHDLTLVRQRPSQPMHRGQLLTGCCRHARVDGLQRLSGRIALPPAGRPHHHHVAGTEPTRVVDRDKHGHPRAHNK